MRWVVRLGVAAATVSTSLVAFADGPAAPTKEQCINAYQGAQVDMKQSALGAAREKLAVCLHEGCPRGLQTDCALWLKEVDARSPSVVLSFKGRDGADMTQVTATIDGKPAKGRTDGRSFEVDPGEHVFVFQPPGEPPVSVKAVVREGEKSQRVSAVSSLFVPVAAVPSKDGGPSVAATPAERPVPWQVYALGGLGVAGLGSFTGFAISGSSGKSDLDACKPSCLEDDVSSVRTRFIVADISLAISVVALAAATAFYFTRPESPSPRSATSTSPGTFPRAFRATWLGSGVRGEF